MAIPIFWRLICGYSVILILSVGLASYSMVQLGHLSHSAHAALNRDHRMIAYQETLADVFLSEVRYAGKFIITHAPTHGDHLRQFKGDFRRHLEEVKALAESPDIKHRLARVEEFHFRYHDLFDQEVTYIKARQPYADTRYREEKEKVLENLLTELALVKVQLQQHLQNKLESIGKAAQRTRTIAMMTTLLLILLGIVVSFFISKSITRPLSELKRLAQSRVNYPVDSGEFFRIPEIQGLADAYTKARREVADIAAQNAEFARSMTEQFARPLLSIHKRLRHLKSELADTIKTENEHRIDVLAEEIMRLIQRFPRISEAVAVTESAGTQKAVSRPQPITPAKNALEKRLHLSDRFLDVKRRKLDSVITFGRSLRIIFWNTIRESIATLGYGKVKKP
jgi:CHASE3 domain sensor protein